MDICISGPEVGGSNGTSTCARNGCIGGLAISSDGEVSLAYFCA